MRVDWLCVITGPEHRENGLLNLRKWTQILLRNPTIPRLASQGLEPESLSPEPGPHLLCVWGGVWGVSGQVAAAWPSLLCGCHAGAER